MQEQRFAFSLNGDHYQGNYPTRKEARQAALEAVQTLNDPPSVVFVARVTPRDPHATNHARDVLREMTRRMRDATGDSEYLLHVTPEQRADLDQSLQQTILNWLDRHNLRPLGQRIDAISEYPVPLSPAVSHQRRSRESGILGGEPDDF